MKILCQFDRNHPSTRRLLFPFVTKALQTKIAADSLVVKIAADSLVVKIAADSLVVKIAADSLGFAGVQ
jgi:ribonuclease HII